MTDLECSSGKGDAGDILGTVSGPTEASALRGLEVNFYVQAPQSHGEEPASSVVSSTVENARELWIEFSNDVAEVCLDEKLTALDIVLVKGGVAWFDGQPTSVKGKNAGIGSQRMDFRAQAGQGRRLVREEPREHIKDNVAKGGVEFDDEAESAETDVLGAPSTASTRRRPTWRARAARATLATPTARSRGHRGSRRPGGEALRSGTPEPGSGDRG